MSIKKFKASFSARVFSELGNYRASEEAVASVHDLRKRINAVPPVRLLALGFSVDGVAICLEPGDLAGYAVFVDLTRDETAVTAANLAAALGLRDLATCVASVIDTVAGLPGPDADRVAALIFLKVSEYAPQYRLACQKPEPHPPPS